MMRVREWGCKDYEVSEAQRGWARGQARAGLRRIPCFCYFPASPMALILQYNPLWEADLETSSTPLPGGWTFTTDHSRYREARVVLFHIPSMPRWRWPLKQRGQKWVLWSMESDRYYPRQANRLFRRLFDLTMTYHCEADVWTPYLFAALPGLLRAPVQPKTADGLVAFFARNAHCRWDRTAYVAALAKQVELHAYGPCLRNRRLASDQGTESKRAAAARYKFTIAFENSIGRDYVTEKVFDALIAGSVPLYFGAPNVEEFLPGNRCIINAADFAGPRELADYLRHLDADDAEYQQYLAWRAQPFRSSFLAKCESLRETPLVRLCRLLEVRRTMA